MARIKLLLQGSSFAQEENYKIGFVLSNNGLGRFENALLLADGMLKEEYSTAPTLYARVALKRFLESLETYRIWKKAELQRLAITGAKTNFFMNLPEAGSNINFLTETDDDKPSQILQMTIDEVKIIAEDLRLAYDTVTDFSKMDEVVIISEFLEPFENYIKEVGGAA